MRAAAILSPALAALLGCATTASPTISAETKKFVGDQGQIIWNVDQEKIEINNKQILLSDCSNSEFFCYKGQSFHFAIPRYCEGYDQDQWTVNNFTIRLIGVKGHSGRILVSSNEAPNFAFVVSEEAGLDEIYHDIEGRGLFADNREWSKLSFSDSKKLIFYPENDSKIFACKATRVRKQ